MTEHISRASHAATPGSWAQGLLQRVPLESQRAETSTSWHFRRDTPATGLNCGTTGDGEGWDLEDTSDQNMALPKKASARPTPCGPRAVRHGEQTAEQSGTRPTHSWSLPGTRPEQLFFLK